MTVDFWLASTAYLSLLARLFEAPTPFIGGAASISSKIRFPFVLFRFDPDSTHTRDGGCHVSVAEPLLVTIELFGDRFCSILVNASRSAARISSV